MKLDLDQIPAFVEHLTVNTQEQLMEDPVRPPPENFSMTPEEALQVVEVLETLQTHFPRFHWKYEPDNHKLHDFHSSFEFMRGDVKLTFRCEGAKLSSGDWRWYFGNSPFNSKEHGSLQKALEDWDVEWEKAITKAAQMREPW